MAFASGGKGIKSDINVTPLIDVVLVLLIVFMVLVPKLLNMMIIDVPPKAKDEQKSDPATNDTLVVTIGADDTIAINGEAVRVDDLADKVRRLMETRTKKLMFFNPDDDAQYGFVNKVMDICRGSGVKTIGIMTKG